MPVVLTNELEKKPEQLIQILGDRIEEIERTLLDDEDFCNKDIDATYQTALKYIQSLEEKLNKKLNELKDKLDQTREENVNMSKQNKKQFDDEIEEINQLFSSGKHQEALEKLNDYEKRFAQRSIIIENIPKLKMNEIDINRYFSFDNQMNDPSSITTVTSNENSFDNIKRNSEEPSRLPKFFKNVDKTEKPSIVLSTRLGNHPIITNNNSINQETKSSFTTTASCSMHISTRLLPTSSSKNVPVSKRDTGPSSSIHNYSHGHATSYTQARSIPTLPNMIPPLMERQMSYVKNGKGEILNFIHVCQYQHDRNKFLLMTCTIDHIILFKSQLNRTDQWCLSLLDRSDRTEYNLDWSDGVIISMGFIDKNNIYIFTEHDFLICPLNSFSRRDSFVLSLTDNNNSECFNLQCGIGTVDSKYIYHIHLNNKSHWILSITELEKIHYQDHYDLTERFPDIKRFIHICINDKTLNFLVEMDGSQYAVMFCLIHTPTSIELKRLIKLSYAENPLTICSIFNDYLKKYLFFINDPDGKIIHILTHEKYLQSYSLIAYALCYIEESHELLITSTDAVCSINLNEQDIFLSKFY